MSIAIHPRGVHVIDKTCFYIENVLVKKYLPVILIGVGLVVLFGAFLAVKNNKSNSTVVDEETVKEIPFSERPFVSLTPSSDGFYLKLSISQVKVKNAASLDYELLYTLSDGRTQGVPGTVKLTGGDIVKDLLLGSESNGKFRYDEGVEGGTLTIRFRDSKGKLLGKLSTKFTFSGNQKEGFSVIMDSFSEGEKTFSSN